MSFLLVGIGVKILEVVDWSQASSQSSQLELSAATRALKLFQAFSSFFKLLQGS